jgi:hypothetical protein
MSKRPVPSVAPWLLDHLLSRMMTVLVASHDRGASP